LTHYISKNLKSYLTCFPTFEAYWQPIFTTSSTDEEYLYPKHNSPLIFNLVK
jgi:hypothetical protein